MWYTFLHTLDIIVCKYQKILIKILLPLDNDKFKNNLLGSWNNLLSTKKHIGSKLHIVFHESDTVQETPRPKGLW